MTEILSKNDVSVVVCGEAGQGIDTITNILIALFKLSGFNLFSSKEYMSRIRGGNNSTEIRVSATKVAAFVDRIDILVAFNKSDINHLKDRISPNTIIFTEKENIEVEYINKCKIVDIPFSKLALDIGGRIFANILAAGFISGLFNIDTENIDKFLRSIFRGKDEDIIKKNTLAANKGYQISRELLESKKVELNINIKPDSSIKDEIMLTGNDAIAFGCIAGGCDFISSYPMSPGTGVLTLLAKYAKEFDIVVEQAEDEISAINMSIGAWYSGARSMVTTSGGGFALMEEGVSLAGMIESPIVIHIAQRPGPATGLPTRMEQGDLELALYSGHGEFPRIIYAPGTFEQAFDLSQRAFNISDKFQIPVFILSDQYFLDSHYNLPAFSLDDLEIERYIVPTAENYKRYKLTDNGISPRGIPGNGDGLVLADSDEHDEEGHITEDLSLRVAMTDKRLKKFSLIEQDIVPPELIGNSDYKILIIGWGSTYHIIKEAIENLNFEDIAFLHFSQVYPLHKDTINYLKRAETLIVVENNATSQFGKLIKLYTGIEIRHKILKYNGMPFSIEDIDEELNRILKRDLQWI